MDNQELQNKIAEYYQKLPLGAQRVFSEMKWLEELRRISKKYGLDNSQIQILGTETTLVLLGIIHLEEYEEILIRELHLSKENTDQLIAEIDESVLRNIRGDLQNSYSRNLDDISKTEENIEIKPTAQGVKVNIESTATIPISNLPKNVLEAVESSNYKDTLYKIAEENDLSIEQMGQLEEAIAESFLGEIQPADFGRVIKSRLGLADEKVNLLVNQINEKILKEIRRKIMGENNATNKIEEVIEINQNEKDVMQNAGFTINNEEGNKIRTFNANDYKESYMQKAGIAVEKEKIVEPKKEVSENREEIMQKAGIKVVDAPKNTNIFASKLGGEVKSQTKETDHSFQNLSNQNNNTINLNNTKSVDPYRMPIE